jgi:hypothetical protein
MDDAPKLDGAYVALLLCGLVAVVASDAHFRRTGRLPFQPGPPFRATPDERPGPRTPLERALDRGEAIYRGPADPPATGVVAIGPKGPDGRIIPLAFESRDGTIAAVLDERGNVTRRAGRTDDEPSPHPYTTRHYEAAMDSKSLAELLREIHSRLVEGHRQNP